ncbi:hypothetical protein B0H16DRAFT_1791606 [Mycena metata]|uniref:Uncharacterized protein n=1 Tax=Mycena metata TaxID=1033252 RepID=A0AAD7HI51_9AGAR|nr:hypothetical protein B0H16DRAFT_1791606 [Mycena metata]
MSNDRVYGAHTDVSGSTSGNRQRRGPQYRQTTREEKPTRLTLILSAVSTLPLLISLTATSSPHWLCSPRLAFPNSPSPKFGGGCHSLGLLALLDDGCGDAEENETTWWGGGVSFHLYYRRSLVNAMGLDLRTQVGKAGYLQLADLGKLDGCPPLSATDSPSFQSLARLTVWGSTTQLIKNFLQWCERTPVTLLGECRFYCNVPTTVVYDLIVALGSDDMVRTNPTAVLRPLLVFSNFSFLAILSPLNVYFDNGFIDAMSIAWPKIETLRFPVSSIDTRRRVLLSLSIKRICPPLSPSQIPRARAPRVRQTQFASLDVMNSAIEAPAIVARYLSAIFPGLQSIEADPVDGLTDEEEEELRQAGRSTLHTWMKVGKLVPLLAAARSEEETFWMAQAQTPGEAAP